MLIAASAFGALALIGALFYRMSPDGSLSREEMGKASDGRRLPPLVRKGKTIFIPDGSPYRAHIVVAPVETRNLSLSRVVPGAVEADPARTVRVLAPVNGRVSELDVELGDNVKRGQPLATIDSGDLAQAVAAAEKARASAKLTKSSLDRATGLNKAGGLALRELEQAQNDYLQATSELKRAEARLDVIGDNSKVTRPFKRRRSGVRSRRRRTSSRFSRTRSESSIDNIPSAPSPRPMSSRRRRRSRRPSRRCRRWKSSSRSSATSSPPWLAASPLMKSSRNSSSRG